MTSETLSSLTLDLFWFPQWLGGVCGSVDYVLQSPSYLLVVYVVVWTMSCSHLVTSWWYTHVCGSMDYVLQSPGNPLAV